MQAQVTEKSVRSYLDQKNIAHADLGYGYLVSAISLLVMGEVSRADFKAQTLYKIISAGNGTSPTSVERAIRSSIRKGANRNGEQQLHVTNKEFIAYAADVLAHGDSNAETADAED